MVTTKKKTALPAGPACTVVDGCTGRAVLQAARACDSCDGATGNLRDSAQKRRAELVTVDQREEQIKAAARARDGSCGCGDPGSHDGSPPATPKRRARAAADFVTRPTPCPRPQSGELTALDVVTLHMLAERRRELGEQVEALDAAIGHVAAAHTHPVFACAKHQSRLS